MNDGWHMALIAFVAMITPGPNNILVTQAAATGTRLGTVAVIAAIVGGSMMMLAAAQMGVSSLLAASPGLHLALKLVSAAVLVGIGIAMMTRSSPAGRSDRNYPVAPLSVLGFQFVNPKGWALMLAVGAMDVPVGRALLIVASVTLASMSVCAMAGVALGRMITDARRRKFFTMSMGALLAISAPLVLIEYEVVDRRVGGGFD